MAMLVIPLKAAYLVRVRPRKEKPALNIKTGLTYSSAFSNNARAVAGFTKH
mgnify:CR=1 FL=1